MNFYNYAYNCLKEAIFATDEEGAKWYNSDECTIDNFFGDDVYNGMLYNSSEYTKANEIGKVSVLAVVFEEARIEAYETWLENH